MTRMARGCLFQNINASIKRFKFFSNTVDLNHIRSGFAMGAIKMVCAINNRRFKTGQSMSLDQNLNSYLPNLQRAYLMRTYEERIGHDAVNVLWEVVKEHFSVLHDYTRHSDWVKVRQSNLQDIKFPAILFDYVPNDVYKNLEARHIYWFSERFRFFINTLLKIIFQNL